MIDNSRESALTQEYYKWEDSCCYNNNNINNRKRKNCCFCNNLTLSYSSENSIRSKYRRISEPLTQLSQFELLSNALKLEDFVLINTLGKFQRVID
jgi:hypothetical protein